MASELETKQERLNHFLDRQGLDGVILQHRNNFAWITGGRDNHIANNTPVGVAAILATRDSRLCLANTIEAPRMKGEELAGTGIDVVSYPWWDRAAQQRVVREVIGDRTIAADFDETGLGLPHLPGDFNELRWSLVPEEIERYRDGAQRASEAMENACRALRPGDSEHDIAGYLDEAIHQAGCNPVVTLIASDQRIEQFRHPIPTNQKAKRYVMLVTCAKCAGLIACLTRFVHFGKIPAELKQKHQAICDIDAAVNLATRPGRTLGDVFHDLQRAYAAHDWADQWQFHHQGGPTGYSGREAIATPGNPLLVHDNQAFAWNPSIPGTKSEDTVLCTTGGIEVLSRCSDDWPQRIGRHDDQELPRADILEL